MTSWNWIYENQLHLFHAATAKRQCNNTKTQNFIHPNYLKKNCNKLRNWLNTFFFQIRAVSKIMDSILQKTKTTKKIIITKTKQLLLRRLIAAKVQKTFCGSCLVSFCLFFFSINQNMLSTRPINTIPVRFLFLFLLCLWYRWWDLLDRFTITLCNRHLFPKLVLNLFRSNLFWIISEDV